MTAKSIIRTLALGGFVSVVTPPCEAQTDYCAYEVVVRAPDGRPVVAVVTALRNGKPFASTVTDEQGIARFCDAPARPIQIQVGGNSCGSVLVRYLSPLWMKTRQVFVTFDDCSEGFFIPGGCHLWIRVHDKHGDPLPGVLFETLSVPAWGFEQTRLTDRYGRLFWFVPLGKTLEGRLVKDGYAGPGLRDECRSGEPSGRERVVVLERLPNPGTPAK